ncbi:aminotransferase class I/II-fold pyridoxal phosphate-dependent enzyme [soil metagenome]
MNNAKFNCRASDRSESLTAIGVERMGDLADTLTNPQLLRLENLDTDILPPAEALDVSAKAVYQDDANSYLPFFGHNVFRQAATELVTRLTGLPSNTYDWRKQCFFSAGGCNGVLNVLLACINPGDEVVLTSPTYVGLINRVKLAGGIPKFIPLLPEKQGWRLDIAAIDRVVSAKTRAFLLTSPSMPTGAVLNKTEWEAVVKACLATDAWMIYDAAMERLLFDNIAHIHPASLANMAERTITVGAASKEYRMIGWRVGWVVCPLTIAEAIGRVSISNVVCPVGIAQQAVAAAIQSQNDGIIAATQEWQTRRDVLLTELQDFNIIKPQGGWSLLIDVSSLGYSGKEASKRLLENANIAVTSMENWGAAGVEKYIRLVYSNESCMRLEGIGERMRKALAVD